MTKRFGFAGIGNACMDIVAAVDDSLISEFSLTKGICTYIDLPTAEKLMQRLKTPAFIPGGCAANTAACLASLGTNVAVLGRIANDTLGQAIAKGMDDAKIHFEHGKNEDAEPGSTRVFCLTTPDGQRTFAAYYGAGALVRKQDLHHEIVTDTQILHMDGFAFVSTGTHGDFLAAAALARESGGRVSFSPSDLSVVEKYPAMVASFVDICDYFISNEGEGRAISGTNSAGEAADFFRARGKTGAITDGANGALVFSMAGTIRIPARAPESKTIDTNGAGDHFTAGFLYGILQGWPLEKAGRLGVLCATDVLGHAGARPLAPLKKYIEEV